MANEYDILNEQYAAACEFRRPCIQFKPRLSLDGDKWCALYGDNLQEGVAGFGDSPADAMWDFDRAWVAKISLKRHMHENSGDGSDSCKVCGEDLRSEKHLRLGELMSQIHKYASEE